MRGQELLDAVVERESADAQVVGDDAPLGERGDRLAHRRIAAAERDDAERGVGLQLDDGGGHGLAGALCLRARRSITSWYSSGISV